MVAEHCHNDFLLFFLIDLYSHLFLHQCYFTFNFVFELFYIDFELVNQIELKFRSN